VLFGPGDVAKANRGKTENNVAPVETVDSVPRPQPQSVRSLQHGDADSAAAFHIAAENGLSGPFLRKHPRQDATETRRGHPPWSLSTIAVRKATGIGIASRVYLVVGHPTIFACDSDTVGGKDLHWPSSTAPIGCGPPAPAKRAVRPAAPGIGRPGAATVFPISYRLVARKTKTPIGLRDLRPIPPPHRPAAGIAALATGRTRSPAAVVT
jgi:hypothetical protein